MIIFVAQSTFKVKISPSGMLLPSLDAVLAKALSPAAQALLRAIVTEADRQGADRQGGPIYLVGGFVRDLLLGRPKLDFDLVFEGNAIRLAKAVVQSFGGELRTHSDFGTAVWWLPLLNKELLRSIGVKKKDAGELPAFIDFISARGESYAQPASLPTVRFADLHTDQFRRDFTINTLALGLNGLRRGQVIDSCGGLPDLKAGVLRVLHAQSFSDDPTRIFRIHRFAGRLGFRVETTTAKQYKQALPAIKLLSGERIYNELEKVLQESERVAILKSLQKSGALSAVHPKLTLPIAAASLLSKSSIPPAGDWELDTAAQNRLGFVLWLMFLPINAAEQIADRLRFDGDLSAAVIAAARLRPELAKLAKLKPSEFVSRVEKQPMLSLYALHLANRGTAGATKLLRYVREWRHLQPRTDGETLRKLGLKPGPIYKTVLGRLRSAWLDGKVRTANQESVLLKQLLDELD
jgi:tRNA nucleotidyltransferase (CCA-adding enzyme)